MAWKIKGQHFENCSCDVPCPCTVSLDFGADRDPCNAFLVFHVESGEVDGVDVSELTVAAIDFAFEGGSAFANPFSWAA